LIKKSLLKNVAIERESIVKRRQQNIMQIKNRIPAYLQTKSDLLGFFLLLLSLFGGIFFFGHLPWNYFVLGAELSGFLLFVYLILSYFSFVRKESLEKALERLEIEKKEEERRRIEEKRELSEYFLLWVHQIKTPITVSKLLLRKTESEHKKKLEEQMFYIEEYSNMAMNYLKMQNRSADMDIHPVDLEACLKRLFKKYAPIFIEKQLSLHYEGLSAASSREKAEVISDEKWLSILLEQLLSNALKYTKEGSISFSFDRENSSLRIQDTGIGIPSSDLKKIFDLGYSGFNGRATEKSSGLGLYMVQKIAGFLQISVSVESTVAVGSCFTLRFPS
jgi:sensor histidine kinase